MFNQKKLPGQVLILLFIGVGIGYSFKAYRAPEFAPPERHEEVHATSDVEIDAVINDTGASGPAILHGIEFEQITGSEKFYDMNRPGPMEGAFFVDARGVGSYEGAHIPGALHIDAETIRPGGVVGENVLPRIPKDAIVVVYCGGGECDLSKKLGWALIGRGYKKVFIYKGGWNDWIEQGGPQVEGPMDGEG
jgi:rhodanese-related sulfurtransferase